VNRHEFCPHGKFLTVATIPWDWQEDNVAEARDSKENSVKTSTIPYSTGLKSGPTDGFLWKSVCVGVSRTTSGWGARLSKPLCYSSPGGRRFLTTVADALKIFVEVPAIYSKKLPMPRDGSGARSDFTA
jgi:hypothetical protein